MRGLKASTVRDSRTDTSKDEEQSGDKLSNVGFHGGAAEGIIIFLMQVFSNIKNIIQFGFESELIMLYRKH